MKKKLRKPIILASTLTLFLGKFTLINAYNGEDLTDNNIYQIETTQSKGDYYKEVGTKLDVEATAYTGDTITSTGTTPKWGTIAVDPKVIPYGTKIYIPCFDEVFVAEDCGSAIKGNKIDIFMDNEKSMNDWGRQNIEIYLLEDNVQI